MPEFQNIINIDVLIDGASLPEAKIQQLVEVTVDQSMGAPDVITLRFNDPNLVLADDSTFDLGGEVEVKLAQGMERPATVTKGEIFSIEPNVRSGRAFETVIRAFHKFNRLHHGRKTRTFLDSKDSDYVSTIANEYGLQMSVDTTSTVYPYMVQWNQTDMEFLRERARRLGYLFYTDATKLYFKKYDTSTEPVLTITPEVGLGGFRPRMTLSQQVGGAKVRAWDPKTKRAVVGQGSASSEAKQGGATRTGAVAVNGVYSSTEYAIVDPTVLDSSDAEAIANGYLAQRTREYVEAEADCTGNAKLRPGEYVAVGNVGERFGGKYMITTARHLCNAVVGYVTTITMTGGYPERIGDMLGSEQRPQRVTGVMPAIVTNLADPENKGRIKVKFPQMPEANGVELESGWMRMATPMAGNGRGFQFHPEVADEVLVAFEGGEPTQGVIIGSLWNGSDASPMADSVFRQESKVKKRSFKSMAGHEIIFGEDQGDDLSVTVKDSKGNTVLLDAKNQMVKVKAVKDMTIEVEGDLKISAKGNITMESTKNLDLKATQNGSFKATSNLNLEATSSATLKGTSGVTVEGTATATVKGAKVEINGSAMAELKGALVKIN